MRGRFGIERLYRLKCIRCGSGDYIKSGGRYTQHGEWRQEYKCKKCLRLFTFTPGISDKLYSTRKDSRTLRVFRKVVDERKRHNLSITARSIANELKSREIEISHETANSWLNKMFPDIKRISNMKKKTGENHGTTSIQ